MSSIRPRSASEYLDAIRRRKLAIAVPALVVLAASTMAIARIDNVYESSTVILVESMGGQNLGDFQRRLSTIQQQVLSRSRLEAVIGKYGLYREMTERGEPPDALVVRMRADVDVDVKSTRPEATESFAISYRARDPEVARAVAAELADQLISENVEALQSAVSAEAQVLKDRVSELSSVLRQYEQKAPWLPLVKEDAPLVTPGSGGSIVSAESLRGHQMAVDALKDQQYKLQQQKSDLEGRIIEQAQIVDRQKKHNVPIGNTAYGALVAKKAELQGQRDNLLKQQGLTEKHPRVVSLDDQITSINRALSDVSGQAEAMAAQTAEERELRALESERNRLRVELEVTARDITRRSSASPVAATAGAARQRSALPRDPDSARLAREYLGLKQTYKEITAKLEAAELKVRSTDTSGAAQFKVLDEANLPRLPIWPNRPFLGLISLGVALVAGLGFAFLMEARAFSTLNDSRDVEYYTRLPLLASVPAVLTPGEKRAKAWKSRLRAGAALMASVAATVLLAKVFLAIQFFEMIGKR